MYIHIRCSDDVVKRDYQKILVWHDMIEVCRTKESLCDEKQNFSSKTPKWEEKNTV